ncbi:MAG: cold shock domain-containing protein, partial [Endozoicomonadaceae bacterium]|nr:cold shock domain-containing protein [Endozoicomonadaceae bacterium]
MIRGELVRWNEDRGFGFISSNNLSKDIFIHISSLKRMNRRPMIGDIIYFKEHIETNGKIKAINASIEGADLKKRKVHKNNRNNKN